MDEQTHLQWDWMPWVPVFMPALFVQVAVLQKPPSPSPPPSLPKPATCLSISLCHPHPTYLSNVWCETRQAKHGAATLFFGHLEYVQCDVCFVAVVVFCTRSFGGDGFVVCLIPSPFTILPAHVRLCWTLGLGLLPRRREERTFWCSVTVGSTHRRTMHLFISVLLIYM